MPDITYTSTLTTRMDAADIRSTASESFDVCGPVDRAKIIACRKWVAENPEYPDGTIAVVHGPRDTVSIAVQMVDQRWISLHTDQRHDVTDQVVVVSRVVHTPPTIRDHLHSLGFDDEMIAVTANVITISGDNDAAATLRTLRDACRKADVR